jgi:HSP20 family molecular chaperone IbpA
MKPVRNALAPAERTPERMAAPAPRTVRRPAVRINESDQDYRIIADMPGVALEQVEITLEQGVLTLRGTAQETRPDNAEILLREYEPAMFERAFELPAEVDRDGIQASMRHGRLTVTVPKAKAAQPRRIAVTAA